MAIKIRIERSILAAGFLLSLSVPLKAQDVPVDAAGQNSGSFTGGVLKFGGLEPQDPHTCLITHIFGHGGSCASVPTMEGMGSTRTSGPNQYGLDLYTMSQARLSITRAGRIGIGTRAPAFDVHLLHSGDVQIAIESTDKGHRLWTLQSSGSTVPALAGTFQIIDRDQNVERLAIDAAGVVSVKTLQITGGSDVAEPFATGADLAPGSLVVIDSAHPGQLIASSRAYDRRVAGVVSGANNIRPGVLLTQLGPEPGHQQVALSGRVYALADTSNGPIRPGDLLTSSSQPAHAMRVVNLRKAQGAIIGKAMSALGHGSGLVLVLVSLQ